MRRRSVKILGLAAATIAFVSAPALAGIFGGHEHPATAHHHHHDEGAVATHPRWRAHFQHEITKDAAAEAAYYASHTACRAGYPTCLADNIQPSQTPAECGYYVGGGAAWHGDRRFRNEGTWGWDYTNGLLPNRVGLGWWHGRRAQGGTGSYEPDGPDFVPEIVNIFQDIEG